MYVNCELRFQKPIIFQLNSSQYIVLSDKNCDGQVVMTVWVSCETDKNSKSHPTENGKERQIATTTVRWRRCPCSRATGRMKASPVPPHAPVIFKNVSRFELFWRRLAARERIGNKWPKLSPWRAEFSCRFGIRGCPIDLSFIRLPFNPYHLSLSLASFPHVRFLSSG